MWVLTLRVVITSKQKHSFRHLPPNTSPRKPPSLCELVRVPTTFSRKRQDSRHKVLAQTVHHAAEPVEWGGTLIEYRIIDLFQVLVAELGIPACCLWTGVPKQVLDGRKVARFLEHLGTEAVAEAVGGQIRGVAE